MPDILRFFFDLLAVPTDGFDPLALLFRRLEDFYHLGGGRGLAPPSVVKCVIQCDRV